jgi:glutathionyl-hydroquinone reductase
VKLLIDLPEDYSSDFKPVLLNKETGEVLFVDNNNIHVILQHEFEDFFQTEKLRGQPVVD